MPDFETYQSPFSWRYGSQEMRRTWSEVNKRLIWRSIWVAMAEAQIPYGIVTREQVDDLTAHRRDVDVSAALEIEKEIHHDLMAEIRVFAQQSPIGGGILHAGATSMDIKDNAEVLQIRDSVSLVLSRLTDLLQTFEKKIVEYADVPAMGFTHLQPAEPTTLGYRLANYSQDFLEDYEDLIRIRKNLKGKGFKGAVGTSAASVTLLGEAGQKEFEEEMSKSLDLEFFPVSTQTYSRRQDFVVLSALSTLAASAHKFAFDLRLLQSEMLGELAEPFGSKQVGSSAMPFKRNPVEAEKIDSLARLVSAAPQVAWSNHANSLLERTLDDSANRRLIFPQALLAVDEILIAMIKIVENLAVDQFSIQRNLERFGPFASLERVLAEAVKRGADRQEMHETLRQISMQAWKAVRKGMPNPMIDDLKKDDRVTAWIPPSNIPELFSIDTYSGNAEAAARSFASQIRDHLESLTH